MTAGDQVEDIMPERLSKDQVEAAQKALRALHDLLPEIDALEQCGKDCTTRRAEVEALTRQLGILLERWGPPAGKRRR